MFNVSTVSVFVIHYCEPVFVPVSCCLKVIVANLWQGWASLSNSLGSQLLMQFMGWRSEMLNRCLGYSKSAKDYCQTDCQALSSTCRVLKAQYLESNVK